MNELYLFMPNIFYRLMLQPSIPKPDAAQEVSANAQDPPQERRWLW